MPCLQFVLERYRHQTLLEFCVCQVVRPCGRGQRQSQTEKTTHAMGSRFGLRLLVSGVHPRMRQPFRSTAVPEHAWQRPEELMQCALAVPDLRRVAVPRGTVVAAKRLAAAKKHLSKSDFDSGCATPCVPWHAPPTQLIHTPRLEALRERVLLRRSPRTDALVVAPKRRRITGKQPPMC